MMANRTVSASRLVAAGGGICTLGSFLVPWATRKTVVYGDESPIDIRAWGDVAPLAMAVLILALIIVVVSAYSFLAEQERGRIEATLLAVLGTIVVALVVTWTLVVIARSDPAAGIEGFERSRTLPSIGGAAAVIGGLATAVAGLVERLQRSLTAK